MYTNMSHYVLIEGIASLIFENISKTLIKNRNTIPFTVDSIKGTIFHKSITDKFDIPYFEDKRKLALLVSDVIVVLKMDWRLSARPVRGPNEKNLSLGFWLSEPYFNSTRFPGPSSIGTTEMFPNLDDMPRLVPLFTSIVMKKLVSTQPYVVDNLRSLLNDKESPTTKALDLKPFKNKKEMEVVCRALVEALKLNPDLEFDAETFTQVGQIKPCEVFWMKNGSRVPNINKPSALAASAGLICNTAVNPGDENMTSDRRSPRTRLLARDSEFYESPMYLAIVGRLASHFAGKALEIIEQKTVENEQTAEQQQQTYPVAAILEVLRKGEDIVTTTVNPADQTAVSKTVSLSDLYEFHHVDVTQLLYDVHLAMRQLRVMKYNSIRGKLELGFFSARSPLPTGEDANESSSLTTAVVSSASSVSSLSDGGSSSDASVGRFGNLQSQLQIKTVSPPPLLSFGSVSRSPTSIQAVDRISLRSQETKQMSFPPAHTSFFGSNTVGYTHNQPQQQQQQQKQLWSMGQEFPSHNQNFNSGTKFTGYQQLLQQSQQQSQQHSQQASHQDNTQVFRLVHESYQQAPQQQHQQLQQTQQHQYRIVGSRSNPQQKPDCFKSQLSTPPHHHGQHDPTQYQQAGHPRTRFNADQMQQFDYQRHVTGAAAGASGGGAGASVGLGGGYPLSQRNPFKVQQQPQQHQIQQQPRYQLQQQQQQSSYLPHAHHELQRAEQQRYFEGRKVQQTEMFLPPPLHPQSQTQQHQQQQQPQRPIGYTVHKATEQHTPQQGFNPLDIFTQHSDLSRVQPFNGVDDSFSLNTNRSNSDDSYSLFNNSVFDCAKPFDSLHSSFIQSAPTAAPKRRQPAEELWGSVNGELLW